MISYSWAWNKNLVEALVTALRSMGIDLWRDEDGSSILPKMAGATDERMAEAVEMSHTVIICVSSQYKSSANCRQEGKYANAFYKRGKLSIIYVMMDANYTTVSSPNYVDGWLGIMVGDNLWYPMWDHEHVSTTAMEIAKRIGSTESKVTTPTFAVQTTALPASPVQVHVSSELSPLDEAWKILLDKTKVTELETLSRYLDEIGLSTGSELADCDDEIIKKIASYLKLVPKKAFIRLFESSTTTSSK